MVTVTVYSTGPSCMQCTMTKRALDAKGVAYVEVNLRENAAAMAYVQDELGYTSAPVVVVEDGTGDDHWTGFRPEQVDRVAALTSPASEQA